MRARLLYLLVAGALIAGAAMPVAFAAEKHAMRNPTAAGIITLRRTRTIIAESQFLPFHAFERSHERASQSLALCCVAAPPEADMIVVAEDASSQTAKSEPASPQATPTAKANDEPSVEIVKGVTVMRGAVTPQPNH